MRACVLFLFDVQDVRAGANVEHPVEDLVVATLKHLAGGNAVHEVGKVFA